jgi:hypothetical protein
LRIAPGRAGHAVVSLRSGRAIEKASGACLWSHRRTVACVAGGAWRACRYGYRAEVWLICACRARCGPTVRFVAVVAMGAVICENNDPFLPRGQPRDVLGVKLAVGEDARVDPNATEDIALAEARGPTVRYIIGWTLRWSGVAAAVPACGNYINKLQ